MAQREALLRTKAVRRVRELTEPSWARVVHGSVFQDAGEPDIDACISGLAVKIECKLPGNEPTPLQRASMQRWELAGAAGRLDRQPGRPDRLLEERPRPNPQLCRHVEPVGGDMVVICGRCGLWLPPEWVAPQAGTWHDLRPCLERDCRWYQGHLGVHSSAVEG